jgi:hypothetical protein
MGFPACCVTAAGGFIITMVGLELISNRNGVTCIVLAGIN